MVDNMTRDSGQRLETVLQAWKAVAPPVDFEQRVWRGIHAGSAASECALPRVVWIQSHPAWVGALAASLAIMFGVAAGLGTAAEPAPRTVLRSVMHGQTLAASYQTLVSGGPR